MPKLKTCLWFDNQAEDAVNYYASIIKGLNIKNITRFGKEGFEIHGKPAGTVMTIEFEMLGHDFMALNGGPDFHFSEAISLVINCDTQTEVDYYWEKLRQGGDESAQVCGWLKDKYGLSWQIVPVELNALIQDPNSEKAQRATHAMLQMKKLDIEALRRAYDGLE